MVLPDADRLREEDPFTDRWATVAPNRIIQNRSRFEMDVNRSRKLTVYRGPSESWGLVVYKPRPTREVMERTRAQHDAYFADLRELLADVQSRHEHFFVFELHSFCHRRSGPDGPPTDPTVAPDVNVGTYSVNKRVFRPLIQRFLDDLRSFDFTGRRLNVRTNVNFRGGHHSRFVHSQFPGKGCSLAIEFKKFFMDEWTGEPFDDVIEQIGLALASTVPGILGSLADLKPSFGGL
jgi:hypothetical protein